MPQTTQSAQIQYNGKEFGTEGQEQATEELIGMWNESDGEMSFGDMEEEGDWSRTMYRNMHKEYTEPVSQSNQSPARTRERSDAREAMEGVQIPENHVAAFVQGYQMGREDS